MKIQLLGCVLASVVGFGGMSARADVSLTPVGIGAKLSTFKSWVDVYKGFKLDFLYTLDKGKPSIPVAASRLQQFVDRFKGSKMDGTTFKVVVARFKAVRAGVILDGTLFLKAFKFYASNYLSTVHALAMSVPDMPLSIAQSSVDKLANLAARAVKDAIVKAKVAQPAQN